MSGLTATDAKERLAAAEKRIHDEIAALEKDLGPEWDVRVDALHFDTSSFGGDDHRVTAIRLTARVRA